MKNIPTFCLLLFSVASCSSPNAHTDLEQAKTEVRQAEKDFNDLAARDGVSAAFFAFAADNAVINRGGQVIMGKEAIKKFYDERPLKNVSLTWAPDFVDVAASGDLAYTYGKFQYAAVDSTGQEVKSEGIFHTVWRKQADGAWKFVYD